MSLPKEPRQLMINLMYLVLTAMLALNVSAEVMNAFKTIDDSLVKTNTITDKALDEQQKSLDALLAEEAKKDFRPLGDGIKEIRAASKEFTDYVEGIKDQLIDAAGDKNGSHDDGDYLYADDPLKKMIIGKKDKDVTTRMLVEQGMGDELEAKVGEARQKFIETYRAILSKPENAKTFGFRTKSGKVDTKAIDAKIAAMEANIALDIDQNWSEISEGKTSWADFRFRQMPLISVLPLLTKFQTDAKNAEAFAVGDLAGLVGGKEIVFNKFFPVINARKAYVIKGEKFEADISLGAYSSDIPPENIKLTVDGARKSVGKDGVAKYSVTTNSTGKKTIKLTATVTNPLTGEVSTSAQDFEYEVGVRSANVSADKMNVMYIGVPNPISVTAAGISSNELKVNCSGCDLKKSAQGKYIATVNKPGTIKINVSGGGLPNTPYEFRVKRIPDPVAKLGKKADGQMGNGEFKAQQGIIPWLENFDFDAKCKIDGFTLTKVAKRQDPIQHTNRGGRFDDKARRMVGSAKPGDTYYFENVKARCPGDAAGRKINSMVFKIK